MESEGLVYTGGSPISDKTVNDASIVYIHNECSVGLLLLFLAQLGSDLQVAAEDNCLQIELASCPDYQAQGEMYITQLPVPCYDKSSAILHKTTGTSSRTGNK